jgi:hypothetical protein
MKQKRKGNSRVGWKQTEQEVRDLLAEYSRQDQSVKMFCQAKDLPEWRFYSWKKKYGGAQPANGRPAGFVALQVRKVEDPVAARPGELFAEVRSAQGTCIRIFQPVTASYLQSLLS